MLLNYAIIEDEPPAISRLKRLMKGLRPDAHSLGEAQDGLEGLQLLKTTKPQLLFLDIEFPPSGAFGLLKAAKTEGLSLPPIVFTTAYDHYAVEAFRWEAWDYVLKPVEAERLEESLQRVEARIQAPSSDSKPDWTDLLTSLEALKQNQLPEHFTVHHKGNLKVLQWKHVSHLCTENRLLFVHTLEGRFILDRTLDELEKLLAPRFLRCHRSAMVALDRLSEVCPDPGGTGEIKMQDGSRLPVSRERMAELRKRLG